MTTWYSLFCRSDDQAAVAAQWHDQLLALGYAAFNPFGLMPGRTYRSAVRLFAAPPRSGWTRILCESAPPIAPFPLIVECALDAAPAISVYRAGTPVDPLVGLADVADRACLAGALSAAGGGVGDHSVGGIPLDLLPADVRQMAAGIDPRQAGKLFDRLSASMQGKLGGDAGGAANDLLKAADWNSTDGQRIQRLLACLHIDGWREPDFVHLRDAYALHERRRRSPSATLYPGDAETMAAVPDALAYLPIYAGKD